MTQNKTLTTIAILLITTTAFATKTTETKHQHNHGAHAHGAATLGIAFDGANGKIEFKGAAEGVLGFEHSAKTDKDIKTLAAALNSFTNDIAKMIQFETSLNCAFKADKVEQVPEADNKNHSDFVANYTVTCTKDITGSKLTFDFTKFPGLKDVDVTLLAGAVQKSAEYKGKSISLDIK